jgi:hypothetical protein
MLDFAQRTVFRHIALIELCVSKKREFIEIPVRVTLAEPKIVGNLSSNCKEIVDERDEASKS